MAGIGFSLRKILGRESLTNIATAYTVAGIISGGPWLISVLAIILLSLFVSVVPEYHEKVVQFQIAITYLVASSLILSGLASNSFARYVADELFSKKTTAVLSNLNGLMLVMTLIAGVLSFLFVFFFLDQTTALFRLLFMSGFVVLTLIWIVISLLTGLKDYKVILKAFFVSYLLIVTLAYLLRKFGLEAFMLSFVVGQIVLLVLLMITLYQAYPTNTIIDFHFLKNLKPYRSLIYSGCIFNTAIWIDKFVFWYSPSTSYEVLGALRASWFYDLPIFIAYLCSMPGMAVFLLLIETNFSDYYAYFHESIRQGRSLEYIQRMGVKLTEYAYNVVYSVAKIQAITIILIFQFGEKLLTLFHVPLLYAHLIFVAILGTSLQVTLLAIVSILYHMDKLVCVLYLSCIFIVLNLIFTQATIYLGPLYYGFGFTCALTFTCVYGMQQLSQEFTDLEYKVIMLR